MEYMTHVIYSKIIGLSNEMVETFSFSIIHRFLLLYTKIIITIPCEMISLNL